MPTTYTNECTNGGFESNTTGYITGGTNTIASSTEQARFGSRSCKWTYQDHSRLVLFNLTTSTSGLYVASAYVYIPSDYDGSAGHRLVATNFTGGSDSDTSNRTTSLSLRDQWQRIWLVYSIDAGDKTGGFEIQRTGTAPTAGRTSYVDGFMIHPGNFPRSYVETNGATARAYWGNKTRRKGGPR